MKQELLKLRELQAIDSRLLEIQRTMEELPQKLLPAKNDLARLESILAGERQKLKETEAWRKDQEQLIRAEEDAVRQAKSKLQQSTNTREFSSANREISNKRKNISDREDEVLKVFEKMEETKKSLDSHEQDVQKLRAHVAAEEQAFMAQIAELEKQAVELAGARKAATEGIAPTLLRKYEHVQKKKRGLAVVAVKNGVCQGCNVSLPPQLTNIMARFESFETCPQCYRLLYRIELIQDDSSDAPAETA
jgi:predicted  nucleic acid-binding Zn-ribbon protein